MFKWYSVFIYIIFNNRALFIFFTVNQKIIF